MEHYFRSFVMKYYLRTIQALWKPVSNSYINDWCVGWMYMTFQSVSLFVYNCEFDGIYCWHTYYIRISSAIDRHRTHSTFVDWSFKWCSVSFTDDFYNDCLNVWLSIHWICFEWIHAKCIWIVCHNHQMNYKTIYSW